MKLNKKSVAIATAALVVVGGGAAYAYFTNPGSGTGTAGTAAGTGASISLEVQGLSTSLVPGGHSDFNVVADNSGSTAGDVHTVSYGTPTTTDETNCPFASNFELSTLTVTPSTVPASGSATVATGTLTFKNLDSSQDGCRGVSISIPVNSN